MSEYRLFKYRYINKNTLDSLIKGSLYFASPEKLNDPFDCKLDIKKSMLNASGRLKGDDANKILALSTNELLYKNIQTDISRIGICSFSLELKNVLLWSHYANDHKGISILYEFPEEYLNDGDKFIGTSDVTYEEDTLTNYFVNLISKNELSFREYAIDIAKVLISSKSPEWSYEKEIRIIRQEPGPLIIDKSFIKQICFGLHTSDSDKELLKEIVNQYDHEVELCEAVRTENDFGIDIKEI